MIVWQPSGLDIVGQRRISEIKLELGETMDKHVAVFRDEAGIQGALETVRRLKEVYASAHPRA